MSQYDSPEAVERKQAVAGVFHRASSTYGEVGPGFFAHFGRGLVAKVVFPVNARVLDVACGRGAVLFPADEAVGPDGIVNGIDLAEGMFQETRREIIRRGLSNVDVRQMDAENLDFPDSSFDVVLCGFALFFFPQLERALAEFRRVLKPNGQIAVSTWGNRFDKEWEWFDTLTEKYLPPRQQEEENSASTENPEFDTTEGMDEIFTTAGFSEVQITSEIAEFSYATKDEWWETLWSHGFRGPLERIEKAGGAEALARFKDECMMQMDAARGSQNIKLSIQALYTMAVN